jgi:hypothetical protein
MAWTDLDSIKTEQVKNVSVAPSKKNNYKMLAANTKSSPIASIYPSLVIFGQF